MSENEYRELDDVLLDTVKDLSCLVKERVEQLKKITVLLVLFNIAVFAQQNGSFTDSRDGKKYKTVKIGVQTWMAEDLKYAPGGKCYNNDIDYCKKYGRLYSWETAMKVCPSSWHLPSYDEWAILVDFVDGDKVAGQKLKAKSGWVEVENRNNGTDDYGFSALPGGLGGSNGIFSDVGRAGIWWSATSEYNSNNAYDLHMLYGNEYAFYNRSSHKNFLYSIRCLKD
jgi:uncharacterized protein (TIGR02145 family)